MQSFPKKSLLKACVSKDGLCEVTAESATGITQTEQRARKPIQSCSLLHSVPAKCGLHSLALLWISMMFSSEVEEQIWEHHKWQVFTPKCLSSFSQKLLVPWKEEISRAVLKYDMNLIAYYLFSVKIRCCFCLRIHFSLLPWFPF